MAALGALGTIASLAGTVVSAVGTIAAGQAAKRQSDWQAAQAEVAGKEEKAAAYASAQDEARNSRMASSRFRAVAAGSGLSGAEEIEAEIAGYGGYKADLARAAGSMREKEAAYRAAGLRATGDANRTGSMFSAGGTILGGLANSINWSKRYGAAPARYAPGFYG